MPDPLLLKMLNEYQNVFEKVDQLKGRGPITEIRMKIQKIGIQLWDLKFETRK
jgi:hypothetical protein